jgi:hypothetical protein
MAINESKPLVGSSQNNKLGFVIIFFFSILILIIYLIGLIIKIFTSDAKANLLLSPPDMPFIPN